MLTLHLSVSSPVFVMVKVLASGLALPCVAAKETLVGLALMPEVGLRDHHAALSLALQPNVPPPVLLMGRFVGPAVGDGAVDSSDRLRARRSDE